VRILPEADAGANGPDWRFTTPDARIKPKRLYPSTYEWVKH